MLVNLKGHLERTLRKGFKEPQKAQSPLFEHSNITGKYTSADSFSTQGRKVQNLTRAIKSAIFIRVNDLSLNRNIGKVPTDTHMG